MKKLNRKPDIRCRHPANRIRQGPRRSNWQCDDTRQQPGRRLLLPSPADQDHPSFLFHLRRPLTGPRSSLFTRVSIIVTVCWPRARSTWPRGFNRFCALPRGSYFNYRISHPSLTSCTDSYIGLTFAVGWGSRSVFLSSNASSGWPPGTSPTTASRCQYRPLAPLCVQPGFRSVFSSSLERELRQSTLVASSTFRPPFGTRDPELSIGIFRNRLKTFFFFQIWCHITLLDLVVHLLSFHPLFAVRANVIFY